MACLLVALVSAACPVGASAGIGHDGDAGLLGFRFGTERLAVGEWVAYWTLNSIPGAQRDTVWQRIAVVARDTVGGQPAHWIEMTTFRSTRVVMKALVRDTALQRASATSVRARTADGSSALDADIADIARLILKRGDDEPIELRLPQSARLIRSLLDRAQPEYDPRDVVRDDSLDLGDEDLSMPRGPARGRHAGFVTVIEPGRASRDTAQTVEDPRQTVTFATDVWTSSDIPITGILRSVSRTIVRPPDPGREVERSETFLDGYGIGARSEITGRVRLVSPPQTLVRPTR